MFCNKCGSKLDDDSVFCTKCGAKIKKEVNNNSFDSEKPDENNIAENVSAEDSESIIENAVPKKRSKAVFVIVAAVILVIVVTLVLIFNLKSTTVNVDAKSQCNFNNIAQFAYDDSSLYYIGKYNEADSESCLFSTSYNGTNQKVILANDNIIRIRLWEDKILYIVSDEESYSLGIVKKDGTENRVIVTLDDVAGEFDIYNNKLYYLYDSDVHVCALDGSEDEIILSDVTDFVIVDKSLYYSSSTVISVYNLKNQSTLELCAAGNATDLVYDAGVIFFKTDSGLYYTAAGEGSVAQRVVSDSQISHYVIDGEVIYYISMLTTDELEALAQYMAEDDSEYFTYMLAMINVGELIRVDKAGGNEEILETDPMVMFGLYGAPEELYCRISAFSETFDKIEIQ